MKPRKRFVIFALALLFASSAAIAIFYRISSVPTGAAGPTSKDLMDFVTQHKPQLAREIQQATAQNNAVESINPASRIRLAIGWLGLSDEESNQRVSDLITADLSAAKNLELVDRQSLDTLLHEQQMSLSGVIRANSAIRLGKLLRADWFLVGSAGVIHGSNYIVERVVDARNGQSLDIEAFPVENDPTRTAKVLADFVRQRRADASQPRPKTYLVFGEFRDMSANNPHPEFQTQLSSYLTASFQGNTNVVVLERENVETMLQELRLDLAGLTEEGTTNPPQQMQWAFWTVDGIYQFYENGGSGVELVLTVGQVFNKPRDTTLHGPSGEAVFPQAKATIDATLANAGPSLLPPTRYGEFSLQMSTGKQLCAINLAVVSSPGIVLRLPGYVTASERMRRTHDLERAIRAFEAALLLDPDNLEVKMYLANCLWHPYINRKEEAYDYFREVAEAPTNSLQNLASDSPTNSASALLLKEAGHWQAVAMVDAALFHPDRPEAASWVRQAQTMATTPNRSNQYENLFRQAKSAQGLTDPKDDLELSISKGLRALKETPNGTFSPDIGGFLKHFKSDPAEGLRRLTAVISTLKEQYPEAAPYLVLAAFTAQSDTNNPFLPDLLQSMARLSKHPEEVTKPDKYFEALSSSGCAWAFPKGQYSLIEQIIAAKQKASTVSNSLALTVPEKLWQAYALKGLERWQDALTILTNLPPSPIDPGEPGPWGHWTQPFLPGPDINYCREKLGLPKDPDPRLRNPIDAIANFPDSAPFACSNGSVWVAAGSRLFQLDYDLHTKQVFEIPAGGNANTVVCVGPSQIWIGTDDAGLVEFNKTTHECLLMNGRNGLYRDNIESLCLQGDTLWIGFSDQGGVGQLDLNTHKLSAFNTSLTDIKPRRGEPLAPATGVIADEAGRVFLPALLPQTYWVGSNKLTGQGQPNLGQMVHTAEYSAAGILGGRQDDVLPPGMAVYAKYALAVKTGDGPWELLGTPAGVPEPNVTALAFNGRDLWLGGWGYVSVMDLEKMAVRKTFFIHQDVRHLEIAGGYVWLQGGFVYLERGVCRIPLSVAR